MLKSLQAAAGKPLSRCDGARILRVPRPENNGWGAPPPYVLFMLWSWVGVTLPFLYPVDYVFFFHFIQLFWVPSSWLFYRKLMRRFQTLLTSNHASPSNIPTAHDADQVVGALCILSIVAVVSSEAEHNSTLNPCRNTGWFWRLLSHAQKSNRFEHIITVIIFYL